MTMIKRGSSFGLPRIGVEASPIVTRLLICVIRILKKTTCANVELWKNPHAAGMLRVTASSIEKGDPVKLVSQKPSELWSGDVPASWFAIDLGANR